MAGRKSSDIVVRIFKITNSLKAKLGLDRKDDREGHLPEDVIAEADQLIATLCEECSSTIGGYLEEMGGKWKEMRDMPASSAREALGEEVFTLAHEIKDIATMCGHDLSAYFAESLRDYIAKTDLHLDAQRVIIQAHMDALNAVHKAELKEEGGAAAEELKQLVKVAINKFS